MNIVRTTDPPRAIDELQFNFLETGFVSFWEVLNSCLDVLFQHTFEASSLCSQDFIELRNYFLDCAGVFWSCVQTRAFLNFDFSDLEALGECYDACCLGFEDVDVYDDVDVSVLETLYLSLCSLGKYVRRILTFFGRL